MKLLLKTISITINLLFIITISLYADEWVHIEKGAHLEEQGKYSEAVVEYENALLINPNKIFLYNSIGNIYQKKLMNTLKAIEVYNKGLEIDPNNYSLNFNIMYAYSENNDFERSIKHYKLLSKIRKNNDFFTFPQRAFKYFIKDMNPDEIIEFCNRYLSANPSDIVLREKLADIYKIKKDYNNAKIQLEEILKWGHPRSGIYFDLGICYYYVGEYQKAYDFLMKAKHENEFVPQQYFDMVREKINASESQNKGE